MSKAPDSITEPDELAPMPRHVAIIMDGNGRWANARGLPREAGHREGAKAVRRVVTRARELGLDALTLYAFSAQNWRRPEHEISALMALLIEFCEGERTLLEEKGIRFRVIGERSRLPDEARAAISLLEEVTVELDEMQLVLALSYGGREEIVAAARSLAQDVAAGRLESEAIDEVALAERLWTADLPDPDLLIRTSGELRVSNFLLWQIAYAELHVETRLWPEFDGDAL
ncbi:MAG: hypothetical protein RIT45_3442, partial [Pseudomonadota bacterium]